MDLYGVGISVIRMPDERNNFMHIYDPRINTFPEAVFLHEFLHWLERVMREHGYTVPELHDYEEHGYRGDRLTGTREWYRNYMTQNVWDEVNNRYVGLYPIVYSLRPIHASQFRHTRELPFVQESRGVFHDIRNMGSSILNVFR